VVDEHRVQQFEDLVVVDHVSGDLGQVFEFVVVDVVVVVGVEVSEDCPKSFFGFYVAHLGGDQLDELVESDGLSFDLEPLDDVVGESALSGLPKFLHNFVDFFGVDGA